MLYSLLLENTWFWILLFFWLIQVVLWSVIYGKLAFYKPDCKKKGATPPVSVIIAAKDEGPRLRENLPAILSQDYPGYEVVVVNDQSGDNTVEVLDELQQKYPQLKVVTIESYIKKFRGKKLALTLGIRKATHDVLLFTDADCKPNSQCWIRQMVRKFDKNKAFVLGFSPYSYGRGITHFLTQYDTFHTALNYFSLALAGFPYMGVGRNLAYRKSFFMDNKGFSAQLHIHSGDDDLLVNRWADKDNVELSLCPESFMYSRPSLSFVSWWKQKRRHLLAGKYYKNKHRWMLGGIWWIRFIFYIFWIMMVVKYPENPYTWGIFGVNALMISFWGGMVLKLFNMLKLLPFLFILDVIYQILIFPALGLSLLFQKKLHEW